MATVEQQAKGERAPLKAKPRRDVDREALRARIAAEYENTLRYLGR